MDPPARHPAEAVGDGFAEEYYKHMQNSSEQLRNFYNDDSTITRPGIDGRMRASTLPDIIEDLDMLSSAGFDSVEVTRVMSQDSHNGGILVAVDGYFTSDEGLARNFTQTFFLAPQGNGYVVLTDMFKFVDISEANAAIFHAATWGAAICVKNLPLDATIALVEDAFKQFGEIIRGGIEVRNKRSFSYGFVEFKEENAAQKAIEASPVILGLHRVYVEKKRPDYISYWETPSTGPRNIYRSVELRGTEALKISKWHRSVVEVRGTNAPGHTDESLSVSEPKDDAGNQALSERSTVHVKNLPPKASREWLRNAFKRFGPIKSVKVVSPSFNCWYGFVKFEEADAAKRAIEASPLLIEGRELQVEKQIARRVQNQN